MAGVGELRQRLPKHWRQLSADRVNLLCDAMSRTRIDRAALLLRDLRERMRIEFGKGLHEIFARRLRLTPRFKNRTRLMNRLADDGLPPCLEGWRLFSIWDSCAMFDFLKAQQRSEKTLKRDSKFLIKKELRKELQRRNNKRKLIANLIRFDAK